MNEPVRLSNASGVPLFYYSTRNITPDSTLNITDMSDTIPENNPLLSEYIELTHAISGSNGVIHTNSGLYPVEDRFIGLPSGSLIVTDRTIGSKNSSDLIPLYYEYEPMYDVYSPDYTAPEGFMSIRRNSDTVVNPRSYTVERREYPVESGRYASGSTSGWIWSTSILSGNIITTRLLLPIRISYDNYYTVEYNKHLGGTVSDYTEELIDEKRLYYENTDYTITSSGVLLSGTKIKNGSKLYIQKSPDSYIRIRYPGGSLDAYKTKEWEFSVSVGNFRIASGVASSGVDYICYSDLTVSPETQEIIPELRSNNILRVPHFPIAPSSGIYSTYDFTDVITRVSVNGREQQNEVTSIDTNGGYVMLAQKIKVSDNTTIDYKYDYRRVVVGRNLQLNPTISSSGVIQFVTHGVGLCVVPSGTSLLKNGVASDGTKMLVHNLDDATYGNYSSDNIVGYSMAETPFDEQNPQLTVSGAIPSGAIMLGSVTVNVSPEKNIELMDIRRTGGYEHDDIRYAISGWRGFTGVGFFDGEPLPGASVIIIQVPSGVYNNIYESFNKDADLNIDVKDLPLDYAKSTGQDTGSITREMIVKEHTNKYIRDTIERYTPAGCKYIVVDEQMNFWSDSRLK
jgi:hypothetical protein